MVVFVVDGVCRAIKIAHNCFLLSLNLLHNDDVCMFVVCVLECLFHILKSVKLSKSPRKGE